MGIVLTKLIEIIWQGGAKVEPVGAEKSSQIFSYEWGEEKWVSVIVR